MQFPFTNSDNYGWIGYERPDLLKAALAQFGSHPGEYRKFLLKGAGPERPKRVALYEFARKVLGQDTKNYPQEIGDCFDVNTLVLMSSGEWKRIGEIKVGDYIVSHLNNHRMVTRTIKKKYSGKIFNMKAKGHYTSVRSTADHEFIIYQDDDPKRNEWKSACSLDIDTDNVLIPFTFKDVEYQYVYYYGEKIKVDEDFAFIIGWYLAEGGLSNRVLVDGSTSYQKVTYNLCIDEEDIADELSNKLKKIFGIESHKQYNKKDQNVLLLEVYNVDFSNFIHKLIPDNLYGKKIPKVFFHSPRSVKIDLLKSWMNGDGTITNNSINVSSASHDLIRDFFHLSVSCELNPMVSWIPKQEHQTISSGLITFRNNSFRELVGRELAERDGIHLKNVRAKNVRYNRLGQLREIEYLTCEEVKDTDVYCLEVENDSSFIANGYAVHNCTSFGSKNAVEYLNIMQIIQGVISEFKYVFPPYIYGSSRVLIGNSQLWGDGSTGAWSASAVNKYGTISNDEAGIVYSGNVAKSWGYNGPPKVDIPLGQTHLVRSTAPCLTWDDICNALSNCMTIIVCSNQGFTMHPQADGFHAPSTPWGHCMAITLYDEGDDEIEPHVGILNSWGDVMGSVVDFRTKEKWAVGMLRVRKNVVLQMLQEQDSFIFSHYDGFPTQPLKPDFFNLF